MFVAQAEKAQKVKMAEASDEKSSEAQIQARPGLLA